MLQLNSALFNIVLGAVITIASTMAAWGLLHFNQRRVERDRTRRAIIHEADHVADSVERFMDLESGSVEEDELDRAMVTLSTDVLNEDLLQINKLTSPEVRCVYDFYEASRVLETRLRRQQSQRDIEARALQDAGEEVLAAHERVHRTVKRSRLSLFTEWYKERDRNLRNR